jgi:hypothetical protein
MIKLPSSKLRRGSEKDDGSSLLSTHVSEMGNDDVSSSAQSTSSIFSNTMEDSLDEVQAMNTALCFLCRINADFEEVERFCRSYPEALLFEGSQPVESACKVVEEQMRHCKCFIPVCNENRRRVLAVLKRGFEYYRGMVSIDPFQDELFHGSEPSEIAWQFYSGQLQALERDMREIKTEEITVRNRIVETSMEARASQLELEGVSRKENMNRSTLSLLSCRRRSDIYARRSVLEYKLGIETLNVSTLEKEQALIDQERLAARRMQLALLKNAFGGCRRHVCEASKKEAV